eukprot:CAMPEP_0117436390 /NCGR_PEP_ID=MMETSP0759-20121206/982_1 /TAXON_ID=63605 /ORGANISM="Percolomonas cosmopolitus, Strain WS" /LENGTH=1883 /DNA_ID=CAMNT_0005227987 /DNA_START=23 /DNA_END=5674 /DNA_ORIENTATION=+
MTPSSPSANTHTPASSQAMAEPLPLGTLQSLSNKIISSYTLSEYTQYIPSILATLETSRECRNEALSIIKHLKTRLSASPLDLKLPMSQILQLYTCNTDKVFLRQFSRLFLQMSQRWSHNEESLPILFHALTQQHLSSDDQDFIFRIISNRLTIEINQIRDGKRTDDDQLNLEYVDAQQKEWSRMRHYFAFLNDHHDTKNKLLAYFTDIVLFRYEDQQGGVSSPAFWRTKRRIVQDTKQLVTSDQLFELKTTVFRIIEADIFRHEDVLVPIIVGMCDYNTTLNAIAERTMRQLDVDYEDEHIINHLFQLFLDKRGRTATENEKRKCLVLLRKSQRAAQTFPESREVLFKSMFSSMASLTVRRLGFDFFQWMIEISFDNKNAEHQEEARIIFSTMNAQLEEIEKSAEREAVSMVESLYIAIGQLARRYPQLVTHSFKYAQMMFDALEKHSTIRQGVNQGLGSLILAYLNPSQEIAAQFHALFFDIVENPNASQFALMAALQSCNRLFRFEDVPSRFLNLLCAGHQALRVREEAKRGIRISAFQKYRFEDLGEQKYPGFSAFIRYVCEQYERRQIISTEVHAAVIEFARRCLRESADRLGKSLKDYVGGTGHSGADISSKTLLQFTTIAQRGFVVTANADALYESAHAFLDIIANSGNPEHTLSVVPLVEDFLKCLFAGSDRSRRAVAKLVAVLFCYDPSSERRDSVLTYLRNNLSGPKIPERHTFASVQCLGFIAAILSKEFHLQNRTELLPLIKDIIQSILNVFESEKKETILLACVEALGNFSRQRGLNIFEGDKRDLGSSDAMEDESGKKRSKLSAHKAHLIQTLLTNMKNSKNTNLKEALVNALGMLSLAEEEATILNDIRESLMELATNRNEEVIFSAGEALSAICGGRRYCSAYVDELENLFGTFEEQSEIERNEQLRCTLQFIVRKGVLSGKRIVRQSSAIYLMCVLQYSAQIPALQKFLGEIQQVFTILLSDTNEVTTEIAARGLSLVYDMSDEEHRNTLVEAIQDQLSGTTQDPNKKVKIHGDTDLNLFPPGEDPSTRSSKRVPGNYKELLDAAQDVGDPSMIYKLLSVSQHNQIWNTKKAAAFSAVTIVSKSQDKDKMRKILPQLVPKLYRYRHDPNHLISKSMQNMWNTLVENTVKTVDEYLPQILKEISDSLSSSLWRIRESASLALAEVISGRRFEEVDQFLEELMQKLFRCCDDVKDSARNAAIGTLKKVAEVTHRFCNVRKTKMHHVTAALNILVPLYLKVGLVFMYKPIVFFSLEQIHTMTKLSEHAIKPHAAEISATLLESISAYEDASFSYIQQHRQRLDLSQEMLDKVRMDATKGTSVDDTIQLLVPHCDENVMPDLVPKLLHLITHAVGLPTRAAVSRFISDLAKFQRKAIRKYSPNLIKALMTTLQNTKSPGERSEIASCLPYLLNASTVNRCKKVLEDIIMFYERGDHDDHLTAGVMLLMIHRRVPILVTKFYDLLVPVVFQATFDKDEKVAAVWKELFEQSLPSTETESIRLYLDGILDRCYSNLTRSEWTMKQQGARALAKIAKKLKTSIPSKHRIVALKKILDAVRGRIWTGKEDVLLALGQFVAASHSDDDNKTELNNATIQGVQVLVQECTKKNKEYRLEAYRALQVALKEEYVQKSIGDNLCGQIRELCVSEIEDTEDLDTSSKIQMGTEDDSELMLSKGEQLKKEAARLIGYVTRNGHADAASEYVGGLLQKRQTVAQTKALVKSAHNLIESLRARGSEKAAQTPQRISRSLKALVDGILFQLDPHQSPEKVRLFVLQECENLLVTLREHYEWPSKDKFVELMSAESVNSIQVRYENLLKEMKEKEATKKRLAEEKVRVETEKQHLRDETTRSGNSNVFGGNPFGSFGSSDNPFG